LILPVNGKKLSRIENKSLVYSHRLGSLPVAISAYKQRMGIEEMFRDCKTGGYSLEGSGLRESDSLK
jgi:hypothetical protein